MRAGWRTVACAVFLVASTTLIASTTQYWEHGSPTCRVINASESLDEFEQHWRVHCIGYRESSHPSLWSVEGRLVCTALMSILLPAPAPPQVRGQLG